MSSVTRISVGVWIVGLIALLCEHFQAAPDIVISVRVLFGVAACAAMAVTFITHAGCTAEFYLFARLVTRWVYILVYTLALVRVALSWNEAPVRPLDDFQFYVACCVLPLWAFRLVTPTLVRYFIQIKSYGLSGPPG